MAASAVRITQASLSTGSAQCKTVLRKDVASERDIFHTDRPAKFVLRNSEGKLLRDWKDGAYIRELSWKHRVRSRDIEDLLRRAVEKLIEEAAA